MSSRKFRRICFEERSFKLFVACFRHEEKNLKKKCYKFASEVNLYSILFILFLFWFTIFECIIIPYSYFKVNLNFTQQQVLQDNRIQLQIVTIHSE